LEVTDEVGIFQIRRLPHVCGHFFAYHCIHPKRRHAWQWRGEIAITFALSLIGLGSIVEFLIEGKWDKFLFFATIPAGMIIIAVFLLALKIRSSIGQHE